MYKKIIALSVICSIFRVPAYATGTSAQGCTVIEAHTGQVIYKNNENLRLPMASTTKIMTCILALENCDLNDTVTVSKNAQNQEGSSIYLRAGEVISMEELLYGLMLNSGNDAAVAISEAVCADTEKFVDMMNEKALELGCRDTHFCNPNGLYNPEHYSTAHDMALIMSYAMKNQEFQKIVSTKEYQIKKKDSITYLRNHNRLLWQYDGCIGGKTGYTKIAGRCLVSCAEKNGVRLIVVTLSDKNDWADHKELFEYGFEKVKNTQIIKKNDIICTKKINGYKTNLLSDRDFFIPLAGERKKGISCKVHLKRVLDNIDFGSELGYGDIYINSNCVGRIRLLSGQKYLLNDKKAFNSNFIDIALKAFLFQAKTAD